MNSVELHLKTTTSVPGVSFQASKRLERALQQIRQGIDPELTSLPSPSHASLFADPIYDNPSPLQEIKSRAFDYAPQGMMILDAQERIVEFNRQCLDLLNISEKQIQNAAFSKFLPPQDLIQLIGLRAVFEKNKKFEGVTMQILDGHQDIIPMSVSGKIFYSIGGDVDGYLLTLTDCSDLVYQSNDQSLQASQERDRTDLLRALKDEACNMNNFLTESILKRYLAPSLVDELLDGSLDPNLEPQRREVTILFCDIVGFTRMSETMGVTRISELINEYLTSMSEVVFEHQGTIDKFVGDAVMVLFGAPKTMSLKEQAQRASDCAQAMHRAMAGLEQLWQSECGGSLKIRIGIHQGEAIVGNFGRYKRSDYTCIGPTVNLASRIESKASPASTLISQAIRIHLSRDSYQQAGDFILKGIEEPQPLYELTY